MSNVPQSEVGYIIICYRSIHSLQTVASCSSNFSVFDALYARPVAQKKQRKVETIFLSLLKRDMTARSSTCRKLQQVAATSYHLPTLKRPPDFRLARNHGKLLQLPTVLWTGLGPNPLILRRHHHPWQESCCHLHTQDRSRRHFVELEHIGLGNAR